MQHRPTQSMKDIATELSALISEGCDDKQKMLTLLQKINSSSDFFSKEPELTIKASNSPDKSIGIWLPFSKNGNHYYERDIEQRGEWAMWADIPRLNKTKTKQRIILLGESVARGYFYDPCYTVAQELELVLNNSRAFPACEVIDLARTGLRLDGLLEVAKSCMALKPDAVVVFAGNNWGIGLMEALLNGGFEEMNANDLTKDTLFADVKGFIERKLEDLTIKCLTELKAIFVDHGVPVTFVIPGYNLRDWQSNEIERTVPWLPENIALKWLQAKDVAEAALASRQIDLLGSAASAMIESDPFNPYGYELMAEFYLAAKNREEAIKCLELARDTALLPRNKNIKPRCFSVIEKTIRSLAPGYGIETVNLSEIFKLVSDTIPGRSLFMDHCHLTIKGIQIAVRFIAQRLLGILEGKKIPLESIVSAPQPDNDVLAIAHFGAAIHSAHFGQSDDVISFHCERALSLSGIVKDLMLKYIDFTTRYADSKLCRSFGEIILSGHMRQYYAGTSLAHPRNRKLMDIGFIDIMTRALLSEGIDISDNINELRKNEHAIRVERVNLLESAYRDTYYGDFAVGPDPLFYQARSATTHFYFLADAHSNLNFELVYRTAKGSYTDKKIMICINDTDSIIDELPMSGKWTKKLFSIHGKLNDGVNKIIFIWPYSFEPVEIDKEKSINAMLYAMFPVLGEIQEFSAIADNDGRTVWALTAGSEQELGV